MSKENDSSNNSNTFTEESESILEEPKNYYDKREPEEESLYNFDVETQQRYQNIERIYNNIITSDLYENAKQTSIKERESLGIKHDDNFVYGEMTFRTLSYIYESVKRTFGENSIKEGNFYDLGSGHGHVCVQAALLHPFKSCIGIEYLKNLHKMALKSKEKYDHNISHILNTSPELFPNHFRHTLPSQLPKIPKIPKIPGVKLINDSFFEQDWTDASMVFSNSTCFEKDILEQIFEKSILLPRGAFFVHTTQKMPKKYLRSFNSVTEFQRLMSWGVCRIFIHRKI